MLRSSTLVTLPGVGHLTPTEAPGALRQSVLGGADDGAGEVG
jgi:pimeloyl-ACP methyl ester carboxylesterase